MYGAVVVYDPEAWVGGLTRTGSEPPVATRQPEHFPLWTFGCWTSSRSGRGSNGVGGVGHHWQGREHSSAVGPRAAPAGHSLPVVAACREWRRVYSRLTQGACDGAYTVE